AAKRWCVAFLQVGSGVGHQFFRFDVAALLVPVGPQPAGGAVGVPDTLTGPCAAAPGQPRPSLYLLRRVGPGVGAVPGVVEAVVTGLTPAEHPHTREPRREVVAVTVSWHGACPRARRSRRVVGHAVDTERGRDGDAERDPLHLRHRAVRQGGDTPG